MVDRFPSQSRGRFGLALAATFAALLLVPGSAPGQTLDGRWQFVPHASEPVAVEAPEGTIAFALDDGTSEGSFGVSNASGAQQFLWFNQFDLGGLGTVRLVEISVQFPSGSNLAVGAPIQLVVYHDGDGDPTNGATLLATFDETIQAIDDTTFSFYAITPLDIPDGGDLLIGVVSRFVMTGVTGPTQPAALDTSSSQGRSWLAVWSGDPPLVPELPPDALIDRIDTLVAGNWMIRAVAVPRVGLEIPVVGPAGLATLGALLALAGLAILRRRG